MSKRDIDFDNTSGDEMARELAYRGILDQRSAEDDDEKVPPRIVHLINDMADAVHTIGMESALPFDSLVNLVLDTPFNGALMAALAHHSEADVEMWAHLVKHGILLDIFMLATVRMRHLANEQDTGLSEEEQATLTKLSEQWDEG